MKKFSSELPGMEKVRARFIDLLNDRREHIAHHAVAAWDSATPEDRKGNLSAAQATLHQIAGTAGSLGFAPLGDAARACEIRIISHLEESNGAPQHCPNDLIIQLDQFVEQCHGISLS
ncbi:MAG: HPt (histidine-containing phosphotransfer) domain-containing protein [Sulfitobacter sp.]